MTVYKHLLPISLLSTLLLSASASATIFDNFDTATNSDISSGNNNVSSTANWHSSLSFGKVQVVEDTILGGAGNQALELFSTDTFRRMGATFTPTVLGATTGSTLTFGFDLRFSQAPGNNIYGLRFGLFNSAGSSIATSNPNGTGQPAAENSDFGYYVRMATGGAVATTEIIRETAGNNPMGGTPNAGEATISGAGTGMLNDQNAHSFVMDLVRLGGGGIGFTVTLDSVVIASGTDNSPLTDTFDKVYFAKGNISSDFRVDNVTVAIPEPSSTAAVLIGMAGLFTVYRRSRKNRA